MGKAFIKSASAVKCDYAGIYHAGQKLPDDTDYFVSQTIDIVSEWRIFVHRGNILDLKNYSGDPWQIPDVISRKTRLLQNHMYATSSTRNLYRV